MPKSVKQPVETRPYLKKAHVVTYPPIRNVKVDFEGGLNIIIGSNGVGKTRFISLLNELIELYNPHINGAGCGITLGGKYEITALFKAASIEEEDEKELIDTPSNLIIGVSCDSKEVEGETLDEAIEDLIDELEPKNLIVPEVTYSQFLIRHGIPQGKLPIIDANAELVLNRRGAFIMIGEVKKRPFEMESRLVKNILYTLTRAFRATMVVRSKKPVLLISLEDARKRVAKIVDAFLLQISSAISLYTPLVKVKRSELFQVYHNDAQDELIIKGLALEYYTRKGGAPLPFSALSDGTKRLFYIISEILTPPPVSLDLKNNLRDFSTENKIIFLEEPELGIHPEQLHKLLSLIREVSREHQVIMTTHSPQVLDMLSEKELDRITICELDPKKGTQFRKLSLAKRDEARAYMREKLHLSDFWRYADLEAKD